MPKGTRERLHRVIDQWGDELVSGWPDWIEWPTRTGDALAEVIGAEPGQVLVTDSTTVNLYKLASAALDARPERRVIVTDDDNFPTDQYVLQGLASARGLRLRTVKTDNNPLLLKIKMDPAGHGGASGRYDRLKDQSFEYAWMLSQVGITK